MHNFHFVAGEVAGSALRLAGQYEVSSLFGQFGCCVDLFRILQTSRRSHALAVTGHQAHHINVTSWTADSAAGDQVLP